MKFSLSTGSLYANPLRATLRWARAAGFDGIELVVNPEAIARGGSGLRRLAETERIDLFSVHPTVVPLPGWRERRGGMEPTMRLAQEAGAPMVVMHTPRATSLNAGEGLAYRRRIERWQDRLAQGRVQLAIENKAVRAEAHRRYALTPLDRLRAFADRHDLGLVLDTTHAGTANEDLLNARKIFDGRLVNVHLSDMRGLAFLPTALTQHRLPGFGSLCLAELLADLSHCGYTGLVTLEVHPVALRFWWPPAVRRRLARALCWMKEAAGIRGSNPMPRAGQQP